LRASSAPTKGVAPGVRFDPGRNQFVRWRDGDRRRCRRFADEGAALAFAATVDVRAVGGPSTTEGGSAAGDSTGQA
jgi:hypothetical protein